MIEIISGTNRPGSNALRVSRVIEGMYRGAGVDARILSLEEMPPEIFHPSSYAQKPEGWSQLTDRVVAADGLHIVVPEYNGGFPGVLKYFIDMLPFPESFEHRCVCFTGEAMGIWGAFRAVEQLQMIFGYRNAYIMPERVWFNQIHTRLHETEDRLLQENDHRLLADQTHKFADFIRRVKS